MRCEFDWKCTLHRAVVPIGACYAGTLWLGNAAYLYLSVSFIQMLKVHHAAHHQTSLPVYIHYVAISSCSAGFDASGSVCGWLCLWYRKI